MKILPTLTIIVAAASLCLAYAFSSLWWEALASAGVGLLWLAGQRRHWQWSANAGLAGCAGLAAWAVWHHIAVAWMIVGLVAALAAWDLAYFSRRLSRARQIAGEPALIQAHLQRLLLVTGLGWLLAEIALLVHLELRLGWALLLAVLMILGLSRAIAAIRRRQG